MPGPDICAIGRLVPRETQGRSVNKTLSLSRAETKIQDTYVEET